MSSIEKYWRSPILKLMWMNQIFVFQTDNLDLTMECLKKKGVALSEAVRYDWGTYEVRLNDIDGNEIVISEFV